MFRVCYNSKQEKNHCILFILKNIHMFIMKNLSNAEKYKVNYHPEITIINIR